MKRIMRTLLLAVLLLLEAGSSAVLAAEKGESAAEEDRVKNLVNSMTLEEKAAQLFFITPEALTGIYGATQAGELTRQAFDRYPVGGIIYFGENMKSEEQLSQMLLNMQAISEKRLGVPLFLGTDEEGGRVSRLTESGLTEHDSNLRGETRVGSMLEIGDTKEPEKAYEAGKILGANLARYHFNLDFAPVADIFSNPANTVIGDRSFGHDAKTVSVMAAELARGLEEQGICAVLKHFPGHGDTEQDSHEGYAISNKTLEELRECEFLPFQAGIEEGVQVVMMGHISLPEILGDDTPASLSHRMVTEILREELGFSGVIMTDAMNMGAIEEHYEPGEAEVQALEAGVDMILMPSDFETAYEAVLEAVKSGRLSEERIDASVIRILNVKL